MTAMTHPSRCARLTRRLLLASAVGIVGLPVPAQTAWPDKPIRFVVL